MRMGCEWDKNVDVQNGIKREGEKERRRRKREGEKERMRRKREGEERENERMRERMREGEKEIRNIFLEI